MRHQITIDTGVPLSKSLDMHVCFCTVVFYSIGATVLSLDGSLFSMIVWTDLSVGTTTRYRPLMVLVGQFQYTDTRVVSFTRTIRGFYVAIGDHVCCYVGQVIAN